MGSRDDKICSGKSSYTSPLLASDLALPACSVSIQKKTLPNGKNSSSLQANSLGTKGSAGRILMSSPLRDVREHDGDTSLGFLDCESTGSSYDVSDCDPVVSKVRDLLAGLESRLNKAFKMEFAALLSDFAALKKENMELKNTVDLLHAKIRSLEESGNQTGKIEAAMENYERERRLADVVVTGIPLHENLGAPELAIKLFGLLGIEFRRVTAKFIKSHRNTSKSAPPLLLKFDLRSEADSFRRRAYEKRADLTLAKLDPRSFRSDGPVYVRESITSRTSHLLAGALRLKRNSKKITAVYTRNGFVLVRVAGFTSPLVIKSETDLAGIESRFPDDCATAPGLTINKNSAPKVITRATTRAKAAAAAASQLTPKK